MKNIFFILFFSIFFIFPKNTFSQKIYLPFKQNGLWGVMDLDKNILIKPKYHHISFFENDCAIATMVGGEKRGVINFQDKIIIPFKNWGELSVLMLNDKRFFRFSRPQNQSPLTHEGGAKSPIETNVKDTLKNENQELEITVTFDNAPKNKTLVGLMNEKGDTILQQEYLAIQELRRSSIISPLNSVIIFLDKQGKYGILDVNVSKYNQQEGAYTHIDFITPQLVSNFNTRLNYLNNQLVDDFLFTKKYNGHYFVSTNEIFLAENRNIENQRIGYNHLEIPINQINYAEKIEFLVAEITKSKSSNAQKGIYNVQKKELAVDLIYSNIEEKKGVFYLYDGENLRAVFYKGVLNEFPAHIGTIKNLVYDPQANRYLARTDKGNTIFLDVNFKTISVINALFDEMSDFKGGVAMVRRGEKYGVINRSGVLIASTNYLRIHVQGLKIRLYKKENTEFCNNIIIDEQGNKIDEFEATLKLINLKGTLLADEWAFTRQVQQNANILAEKDAQNNSMVVLDRNTLVPQTMPFPQNIINEAPKQNFTIGVLSFVYDSVKTTSKNFPMWHTTLTKPKEKRASYVQISRDSNYVYLQTDVEVQITRSEKEKRIKGELINTKTGERIIEHRFNAYKRMLEQTLSAFEKDELALVDNTFFLEKTGRTIRTAEYTDPKTKKTEKTAITRILHTDLPSIKQYVVKGIIEEGGHLMENSGIYGLMDKNGNFITKPLYNNIMRFDANFLAKVENFGAKIVDKKFIKNTPTLVGYIDSTGKEIVTPKYNNVDYIINKKNNSTDLKQEKYLKIGKNANLIALCDSLGMVKTSFLYQKINAPVENFCVVKKNNLFGVINTQGKEIITPKYNEILECHHGIFAVKLKGFWGFIDKTGNEILKTEYEKVGIFEDNHTFIMQKGKYGIVDKSGNITISPSFYKIETPLGNYAFARKEEKWGLIDVNNGNWVINPTYKNVISTKIEKISPTTKLFKIISKDGTFLLNEQGKKITKNYEEIYAFEFAVAIVKKGINEYNLINAQGKELLKNDVQKIEHFADGLARFEKNNLFGFLDTLGNEKIKPIFSYADNFRFEHAKVRQKNKIYYLNSKGDSLAQLPQNVEYLFDVKLENERKATENRRIKTIQNEVKRKLFFLGNAVSTNLLKKSNKNQPTYFGIFLNEFLGIYDTEGKEIMPVEAENIEMVAEDLFGILQGGKFGYWHKQNGWFLPLQE